MGTEIERKFLVNVGKLPQPLPDGSFISQAYLSKKPCIRVRYTHKKGQMEAFLTIKGPGTIERLEFEYPIPLEDAVALMQMAALNRVEKTRFVILHEGHAWEVDSFSGNLRDLWIAEIELTSKDEKFVMPPWVSTEVTEDPRYTNLSLAVNGAPKAYGKDYSEFEALVKWRNELALDWHGADLVYHIRAVLHHLEVLTVPEEHRKALASFQQLDEEEQIKVIDTILDHVG